MKKHLIAAAVAAAVAVPAAAQVTVYGIIDTSYMSSKTVSSAATPVTAKQNTFGADGALSGSRLGFRGSEDLGGGMKANMQIEMGLETTNDGMTANASNRLSFVGLSGGFGEVRLGRFPTLNKLINDSTVMGGASFNGTAGGANSGWGWAAQANGGGVSNERINNAFHYITPTFSGFNLALQLVDDVNDATTADAAKTRVEGAFVGLNYTSGPLTVRAANKNVKSETAAVAAAALNPNTTLRLDPVFGLIGQFAIANNAGVLAVEETKVKQQSLLASYRFGAVGVVYTYNNTKTSPLTAANELKRSDSTLGLSVPVGSVTFLGQYSQGTQKAVGTQDDKLKGLQVAAVYNLSKRSNVYAAYGDGENKDGATGRKASDDIFAVGLRHSF